VRRSLSPLLKAGNFQIKKRTYPKYSEAMRNPMREKKAIGGKAGMGLPLSQND